MGTRHLQKVITKEGEVKLSQYGQWDGYPEGQGVDILKYLLNANIEKYYENVSKLRQITDEEADELEKNTNWIKEYPYLSRDCGSDIHQMIEDGAVKFVSFCSDEEANKWCEGFYTIDFKNNVFNSSFYKSVKSYDLNNLPTPEQYLKDMTDTNE